MSITLDNIKGIIQVLVPVVVSALAAKYLPPDKVTGFDDALVTVLVTIASAIWSAKTTVTGGNKNG